MTEQTPTSRRRSSRVESLESRRLFAAPGDVLTTVTGPATGHTYHLLERTTWDDGEAKAVALGGHLAVVNDQAEQDFLWSTFGPLTGLFWIGLNDAEYEGRFVWNTGEPSTFTNWQPGEPNNLYPSGERWGNMWGDYGGQWNDLGPDSDQGTVQFAVAEVRNGPDLFATPAEVPLSLQPGESFGVTNTLRNLGSATAAGGTRVEYYLSSDAALDGADRLVAGVDAPAGDFPFNASAAIAASIPVPADLAPGTYVLLAKVDAADAVAEADEVNNVSASRRFEVGAVLTPVVRTVRGVVRDANDLPLHGVRVDAGGAAVHTDYDGTRNALDRDGVTGDYELQGVVIGHNVTFGSTFARFAPDGGATLTATAQDLAGATFSNGVQVDEVLTLDGTMPDGGLPAAGAAPVDLRPIFLTTYSAAAPDGTVRLHRDLKNDKNSGRVSAKPIKALAASARYRKQVEVITARLSNLGFRENAAGAPLVAVQALKRNAPADRAVKLFKNVVAPPVGRSKTTSTIDESTLALLNANAPAAGPMWTNALPAKWSVAPGVTDAFVSRATFEKMRQVAEASPGVDGFVLTRGSTALGGTGKTFRKGGEIEFRWIDAAGTSQTPGSVWEPLEGFTRAQVPLIGGKKLGVPDPAQLGVRWQYVAGYDRAATTAAIQSLLNAGATRVAFNDPAVLQDLGAATFTSTPRPAITLLRPDLRPAAGYDAVIYATF